MRFLVRPAAVVALGAASLFAQTRTTTPTPLQAGTVKPPIFSSDADLVLVDVVVTDKKDKPVLELAQADFRVTEDGVERKILSFVAFGTAAAKALEQKNAGGSRGAASEAPAVSFVPASTVLLIDEAHLTRKETDGVRKALNQIVDALNARRSAVLVLSPWSNVAFSGELPRDLPTVVEAANHVQGKRTEDLSNLPMTEAEALEIEGGDPTAVKRLAGRFAFLNPGMANQQVEDIVRMRAAELSVGERGRRGDTFAAMRIGFAWLEKQPGRHTFLLVTSGFPYDARDPFFDSLMNESFRVNAPIHFLDCGFSPPMGKFEGIDRKFALSPDIRVSAFDPTESAAGSDQLAVGTGGLHIGANDIDRGLARIIDSTRLYYVLGYERGANAKPGFRKIKVEVKAKDVRVRARRGYFDEGRPLS